MMLHPKTTSAVVSCQKLYSHARPLPKLLECMGVDLCSKDRGLERKCVCVFGAPLRGPLTSSYTHPLLTHQACICCYRERERKGGRRCEMQPAHCFAFTLNNVITARSLVSLRFAFPSCLFPLDFLIFLFYSPPPPSNVRKRTGCQSIC